MADEFHLAYDQGVVTDTGTTYRVLQKLGEGGNASTYLVLATTGPHAGLLFALKGFRRVSKPEWRENFLAEIAFLKSCDHPAVLRVYDEGTHLDEHPFVVMEYLPKTLASVIRSDSASITERICYALQLLSALAYLSDPSRSVIHRDIKPDNIFLKGQSCVLGDFGLVKRVAAADDEDLDWFKSSLGPGMPRSYRTPDLVAYLTGQRRPTVASDVYQLGLVVAELFTGTNPQRSAATHSEPVVVDPVGPIRGSFAGQLRNLLTDMLNEDPGSRPTAAQLLPAWSGLLLAAGKSAHALEGRVL